MQPDRNPNDWQQPPEQLSKAPYAASPSGDSQSVAPVVTLTPDSSAYTPVSMSNAQTTEKADDEPVHWQANEYIHHDKGPIWFILFGIVAIAFMGAAIFLMQSITFAVLVPVMAVALLVYGHRPPRILDYTLGRQGLHINDTLYPFADFKGFGIIHDGEEYSVMLIPTKRFRMGVSVYFPEESGEKIVDLLAARLPMQELHLDIVDKIIHKLRI
jgi:hypothetical protein